MVKDFSQVMSERTDKQLIDIVTFKRHEYQPEAIVAAETEIERRKINSDSFYSPEQIQEIQNPPRPNKSEVQFTWHYKVLTVLLTPAIIAVLTTLTNFFGRELLTRALGFPAIVVIHYAIHSKLKEEGYTLIAKDFLKWVAYSLYIYIGLLLILGLTIYFFFM